MEIGTLKTVKQCEYAPWGCCKQTGVVQEVHSKMTFLLRFVASHLKMAEGRGKASEVGIRLVNSGNQKTQSGRASRHIEGMVGVSFRSCRACSPEHGG